MSIHCPVCGEGYPPGRDEFNEFTVDEYGTIWLGEPGSKFATAVGDFITHPDQELAVIKWRKDG